MYSYSTLIETVFAPEQLGYPCMHCDCCANTKPAYLIATVYGEHVRVCTKSCYDRLMTVWKPASMLQRLIKAIKRILK